MGKKRKASSQAYNNVEKIARPERSGLLINTYQDVADSEDEFLDNRDRILLDEGPEVKRRRKIEEEDALLEASDEEVLSLPDSDINEDDYEEEDDDVSDVEGRHGKAISGSDDEDTTIPRRSKSRRNAEDEEEEEGWGDSRQDYYGADEIDTEQAALDEEVEAKRLQHKQLEAMSGADILFGEDGQDEDDEASDQDDIVTEKLPDLEVSENLSAEERLKLLKTRYPELEAIANDWLNLHESHAQAEKDASHVPEIRKLRASLGQAGDATTHIATMRFSALSAYLGACAMYFAVLTSTANGASGVLALQPRKLREHPVIQNMLDARQLWDEVKAVPRVDTAAELADLKKQAARVEKAAQTAVIASEGTTVSEVKKTKKAKKSKAERRAAKQQAELEAQRAQQLARIETDLADLDALASTKPSKSKPGKHAKLVIGENDSDLGDETTLTASELAAKAARKKSLKFYTSQIAQKANKAGARSRDYGGDLDVPHRERLRDREARLNAAAEKRGKQAIRPEEQLGGDDSDGYEDLPDGRKKHQQDGGSDDEDYYDMIASRSKQKKADKKAAADAYAEAKRQNAQVYEVEEIGPDGKRKISYQIEKNKGLTPRRKKEVRNPRVKKKLKYAEKLKKLGSVKQVYKGGEAKGGYGGELSGIKTGLVKSVKL